MDIVFDRGGTKKIPLRPDAWEESEPLPSIRQTRGRSHLLFAGMSLVCGAGIPHSNERAGTA